MTLNATKNRVKKTLLQILVISKPITMFIRIVEIAQKQPPKESKRGKHIRKPNRKERLQKWIAKFVQVSTNWIEPMADAALATWAFAVTQKKLPNTS